MSMLTVSILKRAWSVMNILVLAIFLVLAVWSRFCSLSTAVAWDSDGVRSLNISKDYSQGHVYPIFYKINLIVYPTISSPESSRTQ